jgi:hypothetical protein
MEKILLTTMASGPFTPTSKRTISFLLLFLVSILVVVIVTTLSTPFNGHSFGHPWLQFIDRIQRRIVNIFRADIFPSRSNLNLFQAIEGFIAVGIGPLSYSSEFLEKGTPDKRLRGDLHFAALQMKLKCPPLHVDHPKEKQLLNDFLKENPKPSAKRWRELVPNCLKKRRTAPTFSQNFRPC